MINLFSDKIPGSNEIKKFTLRHLFKIYLTTIIQIVLFIILISSALLAGIIDCSGTYIIPLLDKSLLIGNAAFYVCILLGVVGIFRFYVVGYILLMTTRVRTGSRFIRIVWFVLLTTLGLAITFIILFAFMDTLTSLLIISHKKVALILGIVILLSATVYMWWNAPNPRLAKIFVLLALCLGLLLAFSIGNLFMAYQVEHDADFSIVHGSSNNETQVNIIYKSADGVLTIDKNSGMPVFFPWHEVSSIKVSPSRQKKVTERKENIGILESRRRLNDLLDAINAPEKLHH